MIPKVKVRSNELNSDIGLILIYLIGFFIQLIIYFNEGTYAFERGLFCGIYITIALKYLSNIIKIVYTKRRLKKITEGILEGIDNGL